MSAKILLCDISVSNASNASYTLVSSSSNFPADLISNGVTDQKNMDKSQTNIPTDTASELNQSIKAAKTQTSLILTSQNITNELQMDSNKRIKNAGNKIFMAAMLYSWRKQRHLIKNLSEQLEVLKRNTMKHDHRIHVYEKLYDNEKERNYDLKKKVEESQEDLKSAKSKYDSLNGSNIALKESITLLEQQLLVREEQYEGLQLSFNEMQTALFRSMSKERDLQRQLSDEQRRVQLYIVRENDLIAKIHEFKKCDELKKQTLYDQINFKQLALIRYKEDNRVLSTSINVLLRKKQEMDNFDSMIQNTMNEIIQIKTDIQYLREKLENSWTHRLKFFWRKTSLLRRRFVDTVLAIVFCILPSMHPYLGAPSNTMLTIFPLRAAYI